MIRKQRLAILPAAIALTAVICLASGRASWLGGGFMKANADTLKADTAKQDTAIRDTAAQDTTVQKQEAIKENEPPQNCVVDEVIWVVGDEPILLSDVEALRLQAEAEGIKWRGDPDCAIPEQIAVQKLFLHQAAIDSIEVTESEVMQSVDMQINNWIQMAGSKEKLEEYKKQSVTALRQSLHDDFRDRQLIEKMKDKLQEDVKVTPSEVRRYFQDVPEDSLPQVPTEVEVQIITNAPKVEQAEVDRIKNDLRSYTERVTKGETSFAALARLYSEDPGTARQGGELGDYVGRGLLDPAFAAVAFNLTDPKKISKIVETEFGYHIIQLIDRRGDKIKVRHILRKPSISPEAITRAEERLDSLRGQIMDKKFTFEEATMYVSDDKDTKNNHGLMANATQEGRTSRFRLEELPPEIARSVDTLKVGEISKPFSMINDKGKRVCLIARLKSRTEAHRATMTEDFQVLKRVVTAKRKEELIKDWIQQKLKTIYVKMNDRYKGCDFEYKGWVK